MPGGFDDSSKLKNELKKARNTIVHLEHNNNILKQKLMQESAKQLETQEVIDNSHRIQREFKMRLDQEKRKIEEIEFSKRQEAELMLDEAKREMISCQDKRQHMLPLDCSHQSEHVLKVASCHHLPVRGSSFQQDKDHRE